MSRCLQALNLYIQLSSLLWGKYIILEDLFKDSFLPTPWGESRPYKISMFEWKTSTSYFPNYILNHHWSPTKVSKRFLPGASLKFYTFLHQGFLDMLTNLPRYGQSDDNGEIGGRYSETVWPGENMSAYLFSYMKCFLMHIHHIHSHHTHKYHKYTNNTSVWTCVYIYLQIDIYYIHISYIFKHSIHHSYMHEDIFRHTVDLIHPTVASISYT